MTPADLIAELFKNYPFLGTFIFILGLLLILAIVTVIIIFIIAFFTGKPFPIFSKGRDKEESSASPNFSNIKTSLSAKDFPQGPKKLEKVLNQVNETTFLREKEQYRKQYDALINLLSEAHLRNNLFLYRLVGAGFEPYEVWVRAEEINSEVYKNAVDEIQLSLHAISEITAHTEKHSIRRASIALMRQDGYLHMVSSNTHPRARHQGKIFKVGDTPECGIAGLVAYTRRAKRVPDISKDRYYKKFPNSPLYASLLAVPIIVDDRVLGTFSMDSDIKNAFTDVDEKRIGLFTHNIATTIFTLMIDQSIKT